MIAPLSISFSGTWWCRWFVECWTLTSAQL